MKETWEFLMTTETLRRSTIPIFQQVNTGFVTTLTANGMMLMGIFLLKRIFFSTEWTLRKLPSVTKPTMKPKIPHKDVYLKNQ